MDISEEIKVDCNFRWGSCKRSTEESDITDTHQCKSGINHIGLHYCAYCGVVYLVKRVGIEYLALYADPPRFVPRRDDDVARWLKAWRDSFANPLDDRAQEIDAMLDDYRKHADTSTPLDAKIERGRM